jgi:hypothetical protein
MSDEKRRGEKPIQYRWLPFDERFILEDERGAAENDDDDKAYP